MWWCGTSVLVFTFSKRMQRSEQLSASLSPLLSAAMFCIPARDLIWYTNSA